MSNGLLQRLGGETRFDVVVVGGGINGAGIVRDAAIRGYKVLLVEAHDFASGTSSRSSKLIHGGLRYLEHGEFRLVFESCRERFVLAQQLPHLVRPIRITIPVYTGARRNALLIRTGVALYDLLAGTRGLGRGRSVNRQDLIDERLVADGLTGGVSFVDCQMDDARVCLETLIDAEGRSARCLNYVRADALAETDTGERTLSLRDERSGGRQDVTARVVVNATGPWSDITAQSLTGTRPGRLQLNRGCHIVTRRPISRRALLLPSRDDRRVFFVLPFRSTTLIGTTESAVDSAEDFDRVSAGEIDYLLRNVNAYMPDLGMTRDDIAFAFAGTRPLASGRSRGGLSEVSRRHQVVEQGNLLTVIGGKYSTFRAIAADAVNRIARRLSAEAPGCRTLTTPFACARFRDFETYASHTVASYVAGGMAEGSARHIVQTYGSRHVEIERRLARAGLADPLAEGVPHLAAELVTAFDVEHAATLEDFMIRRSGLAYHPDNMRLAGAVAEKAIALGLLGEAAAEEQLDEFRETVEGPLRRA